MTSAEHSKAFSLVLATLMESRGRFFAFEEVEHKTKLQREQIAAALKHFAESGIEVEETAQGCSLASLPDIMLPEILRAGLKSRIMGQEIHSFKTVASTNETAKRLAESGAPEGVLVVAERQTRGRGRLGRTWHSPAGLGLYFSLILRPSLPFAKVPALSLVAALSICRALEHSGEVEAMIKWPNDCLLGGKKAAGILVELSAELDRVSYAILGIGININHEARDFPSRLRSQATSLAIAKGQRADRAALLRFFLADFEKTYNNFHRYGLRFLGPELVSRSVVLGKKISINLGKKRITGTALGFDENGALRLRDKEGVKTIAAGEVSLR